MDDVVIFRVGRIFKGFVGANWTQSEIHYDIELCVQAGYFLNAKSTCRRVTVPQTAGRLMMGSSVLFVSRFRRIDRGSIETGLRPHENVGLEALINMFHE